MPNFCRIVEMPVSAFRLRIAQQETQETASVFEGDMGQAVARLKDLTARACGFLDAEKLNLLSFHMAACLDHESGKREETHRINAELDGERQAIYQ